MTGKTLPGTYAFMAKAAMGNAQTLAEFRERVAGLDEIELRSDADDSETYSLAATVDVRIRLRSGVCELAFADSRQVLARRKFATPSHPGTMPMRTGAAVDKPSVSFSNTLHVRFGKAVTVYLDGMNVGGLSRHGAEEWKLSLKINLESMPGLSGHGCGRRLDNAKSEARRVILARLRDHAS